MTQPFNYTTDGFKQAKQWVQALLIRGLIKPPSLKRESGYRLVQWANDFYSKFGRQLNEVMKRTDRIAGVESHEKKIRGKTADLMVFDEAISPEKYAFGYDPALAEGGKAEVVMLDMSKLPEWDDFREEKEKLPPRKAYQVWEEGFAVTGQRGEASYLGIYRARSFKKACKMAIIDNGLGFEDYDEEENTHWGCRFFDNEEDARASFG